MKRQRKITPKRRVLKRYPKAYSTWSSLYGEWRINAETGGHVIGLGSSAHLAWQDAAGFIIRYGG